jgi:hypothetical protein
MIMFIVLTLSAAGEQSIPRFENFPIADIFHGTPAPPILATAEQRRYRTRIREGALGGRGVLTYGGSGKFMEKPAPNFAGHYVAVQWGCGSQCVMMAIVDTKTGIIYDPPLSGVGTELYLPLDNLSEMKTEYRPDSSLMILRDACRNFRGECGTYYFDWRDNKFELVKLAKSAR